MAGLLHIVAENVVTDTQTKYCNPRDACAPRANNKKEKKENPEVILNPSIHTRQSTHLHIKR